MAVTARGQRKHKVAMTSPGKKHNALWQSSENILDAHLMVYAI